MNEQDLQDVINEQRVIADELQLLADNWSKIRPKNRNYLVSRAATDMLELDEVAGRAFRDEGGL